jgi:DNA repair protein RecO (recombination protein O)
VEQTPVERLYTFTVSDEVLKELAGECGIYRSRYIGHKFKSLEILENCRLKN